MFGLTLLEQIFLVLPRCTIIVLLSVIGFLMILPLSYGNKAKSKSPIPRLVGSAIALFYAL